MSGPSRRDVAKLLLFGSGAAAAGCTPDTSAGEVVGTPIIPPTNALVQTTVCAHCVVGCGYKAYSWPVGAAMGGETAATNALGVDLPVGVFGPWISPQMHNTVTLNGEPHHIVVMPDHDATVVNLGGDHTLGGSLARRFYNPDTETADRFLEPMIRVDGELRVITWNEALAVVARTSREVLDTFGPLAWGMKTYSYQFYENTYAITKLAFEAIETPCWAPHDKAAEGSDTPGLSDAGINVFSAAYQDWYDAEVIFCSGVSLYDAHGVLFSQWVARGGAKLIVVNPRRDPTADYALARGGLFLQVEPGTDTALHNALCRIILENGWEDSGFIQSWTVQPEDLLELASASWRQRDAALTFEAWSAAILADPDATPERAAEICGIDEVLIWQAAEMLAAPTEEGVAPKASFMLEKGNYWSHNYANTASIASLGLVCGAGNRPGRMISRAGGHQRGMLKAASYPEHLSPDSFRGHNIGLNLDRWVLEGNLAFAWVIGSTWAGGGSAASSVLYESMKRQTQGLGSQLTEALAFPEGPSGPLDVDAVVETYMARTSSGGMVLVQQDIYPQRLTDLADLVLPAAGWGEETFTRMQGERRLRLYPQLVDRPGNTRPDWMVVAEVAQRLGFEGFDWASTLELFHECASKSKGPHAYQALVEFAAANEMNARQVLREAGTTGFQCPLEFEDGQLKETVRYHDAESGRGFSTPTGRANFVLAPWEEVGRRQAAMVPKVDELWVINRRASTNWSSMVEDLRNPFRMDQLPLNYLEMHPEDAAALGIADGDPVVVERDGVSESFAFNEGVDGQFEAVARISDEVKRGVTCAYFNYGGDPALAANNVVGNDVEPITNKNSFKLGRGRVRLA